MAKRALLSVSDKTGIVDFARGLHGLGFQILSTGGTQKYLAEAGIPVTSVEEVTEFPECFGGRVKTMHPKIMGGVLMRRDNESDCAEATANGIEPIDVIVVNLYPFEDTVRKGVTGPELIEQIDIGGPTLLRSAAKNAAYVTVICDVADYDRVLTEMETNGDTSESLRAELAAKVFLKTAGYDAAIADALSAHASHGFMLTNGTKLRYGENPHQTGYYYDLLGAPRTWTLHQGKELSYLNLLDADGAWNLIQEFSEPASACIKHANPSGVATDTNIDDAFQKSYDADRLSAFGVIIAVNRPCTLAIAQKILDQKIFVEVVVAPGYEDGVLDLLKQKPNIRLMEMGDSSVRGAQLRSVLGGMLVQDLDTRVLTEADLTCVTKVQPTPEQIRDLLFAWKVVKHAKSNAIVFAHDATTVGIGCGQTSRVDATWIAAKRAGERAKNSVMASDAFFPFPDSIEEAAKNGIVAIIQPGGSVKDAEVIAKADELGIAMVTTGVRGFRH